MSRLSITSRSTFFFSVKIFRSRFIFVEIFIEIVKTNQDCQDLSRLSRFIKNFEISWHNQDFFKTFSRLQAQKFWQIEKSWLRNVITLTNSRSRLRQTVEICQKCHLSTDFLVSIETFQTFRTCRDKTEISQSWTKYLDHRD